MVSVDHVYSTVRLAVLAVALVKPFLIREVLALVAAPPDIASLLGHEQGM